ncbi:hypothetical protein B0H34DRAFT_799611 [Crassisporium funariophilum]|nr:hypothetical protein B0H34DRAFT_799611 [Crassisporium funariophilum]
MDPLPITLAVFVLGGALKEIISLARKLDNSLEKVSRNMEKARRLAATTLKTLLELEKFYDKHQQVLESLVELKKGLDVLMRDVQEAYTKCTKLYHPPGKSKFRIGRAKLAFKAWKNRNKVEQDITNLKHRMDACFLNFSTFALARIKHKTLKVYDWSTGTETTTSGTSQALVFDENQLAGLRQMEGAVSSLKISDTQTASVVTRSTPLIPGGPALSEAISNMYIRRQVDAVDESLTMLASSKKSYAVGEPMEEYTLPFSSIITLAFNEVDRSSHQQKVIRQTLDILDILQKSNQKKESLLIQEGAWDMINLSIQLYNLDLCAKATMIGLWTVNLYRTLVKADPEIYRPYLALALQNLSKYYVSMDNQMEATCTIAECVELNRLIQRSALTQELRGQLGRALTRLRDAEEARGILEQVVKEIEGWEKFMGEDNNDRQLSDTQTIIAKQEDDSSSTYTSTTLDVDYLKASERSGVIDGKDKLIYDYGRALHQLSYSLEDAGRHEDAALADVLAMKQFWYIHSLHPSTIVDDNLGQTLFRLSHTDFRQYLLAEETLAYSCESLSL